MKTIIVCAAITSLFCSCLFASSAEDAAKARAVAEKFGSAVITVELVIEESFDYGGGGEKRESKMTASAIIVDPSGLAVTSLSSIDPTSTRNQISSGDEGSKPSSKIVEAKLRASDGTEIPADIVLRDRDLDLAVLRPQSPPATPMPFVNMSAPNPVVKLFDELVTLRRLGRVAGRTIGGCGDMVKAVATKPRLFYVVYGSCGLGLPAFTLDGKVVGISVLRTYGKMDMEDASWFTTEMAYVVMPCETVHKIIQQAKKAGKTVDAETKPAVKPAAKPEKKP